MNKEELKKIFEKIIENYDEYNVFFEMTPEINEMINWNGKGKRFIKYIRTIIIEDKKEKIENIEKEIW